MVTAPDGTDFTPNCSIDSSYLDTCQLSTARKIKSCGSFDSTAVASDCAQANDMCYFD